MSEALIFLSNVKLTEVMNSNECKDVFLRVKKYRVRLTKEQDDVIKIYDILEDYINNFSIDQPVNEG
jgi:hypothetical protein